MLATPFGLQPRAMGGGGESSPRPLPLPEVLTAEDLINCQGKCEIEQELKTIRKLSWEAALEIARETEETIQRLCNAVLNGDWPKAKQLAKELQHDEEIDRTHPRVHRISGR